MSKYIIAGGRDFNNYSIVREVLEKYNDIDEIVSGDARGADTQGIMYANQYHIPIQHFPAQWDLYGDNAGFIRNAEMADYADAAIVFWDGKSHGTKNMIQAMKFRKKPCDIYNYEGKQIKKNGQIY